MEAKGTIKELKELFLKSEKESWKGFKSISKEDWKKVEEDFRNIFDEEILGKDRIWTLYFDTDSDNASTIFNKYFKRKTIKEFETNHGSYIRIYKGNKGNNGNFVITEIEPGVDSVYIFS